MHYVLNYSIAIASIVLVVFSCDFTTQENRLIKGKKYSSSTKNHSRSSSPPVQIPNSRYNDMSDDGPSWLKEAMSVLVTQYLQGTSCASLESVLQRLGK